ncbi:MAG TPA: hypothetical protein VFO60_03580, partial [Candidatus Dormibacteraeota bacterium]|nr:hypothetical protein [Candidatus Dormibacteraeota bacterium]
FAQLRCGDGVVPLLRRPMSVARAAGDTVSFVFERVGAGTRALAAMRPGEALDVLGPLGVGFTMPDGGRAVCVSGGLGCAPFPLAVATALAAGVAEVVVLNGAATAARLYPAERFSVAGGAVRVVEATDDGSRGHRGRVTDLVATELARGGVSALWACGPNPMLAALAGAVEGRADRPAICEVSLEAPMGCGFGTCLGCALPMRREPGSPAWELCCRAGPVMDITRVDWGAVAALPPASVA